MKFLIKAIVLLLAVLSDAKTATSDQIPHDDVLESLISSGINRPDPWKNAYIDLFSVQDNTHPNPSLIKAPSNVIFSEEDKSPVVVSELDSQLREFLSSLDTGVSEAPPIEEAIYPLA
ncbi:MAG: hypothetical protein K2Q34_05955 [Alphaproteobacteria bacterium]|nr:hypothetical protein [Alphaproteobacteria bacterium]